MSQLENKSDLAHRGRAGTARLLLARIGRALTRNVLLKVFSLFLAVLLWSVLIASDSALTREKVFPNVEVTVAGQDTLKNRGFIVTDDIAELIPTVRIRADVAQGSYDRVTAANFSPRIDLSKVRQAGEQELQVTVPSTSSGQVLEVEPSRVTLNVQEYTTIYRIPVVVEMTGELKPGLWADTPRADPTLVSVSGPKAMVDKVARAVVKLDQSILSGDRVSTRSALPFVLQDAEGNHLDSPLLQVRSYEVFLNTISVDTTCYPEREIPVDLTTAVAGVPAEGYEVISITAEPASIEVAAQQSVLDALSRAFVDAPIDLEGATGTQSAPVRIKRVTDAKHTSMEEVVITAVIGEKRIDRAFRNLPIATLGLSDDQTAKLGRSKTGLTITGGYLWIKQLKESNIALYVDVAGLSPGEYRLPVQIRAEGSSDFSCKLDDALITVTIAQKAS